MAEQWHLIRGEEQTGPHSEAELRQMLDGTDLDAQRVLVWKDGMADWVDPRTVPDLLGSAGAAAAPATPATPASPAAAPEKPSGSPPAPGGAGPGQSPPPSAAPQPAESGAKEPAQPSRDLSHLNPYETPTSAREAATQPSPPQESGNYQLEVGTCLRTGWKLTLAHFGKLILFGLAYLGVTILLVAPLGILEAFYGVPQDGGGATASQAVVSLISNVAQNVISIFLGIGAALFGLGMVRRTNPNIGILFAGGPHFWSVFLASILVVLSVVAGLILLILPGIYLAIRLSQFQFAIVDQKLGPIEGMKASWAMTKGNVLNLILLGLATFGIVLLGLLALGIGLLWAYPTVLLAAVSAYLCMHEGEGALPKLD